MDLNCVRRITLKAADLDSEPVTEEELEILRKKIEEIKKSQKEAKPPDYNKYSKEKLVQLITDREKDHRKIEAFYRNQVDELEAELSDARELIISLIDERNEVDMELASVRKQKQEFKSQVQCLEIELNKRLLEKSELNHNLELAQNQIHRYSQQLQEEQQKIEMLNTQNVALQGAIGAEKKNYLEGVKKFNELEKELENREKLINELQSELVELRKNKNFTENLTDKKLQDAITNLSMIILNKDKSYSLNPEQRFLVKQIFGENCSKIIEASDLKYQELAAAFKILRDDHTKLAGVADMWMQEFTTLFAWVECQQDLLVSSNYDQVLENYSIKMPELLELCKEATKFCNDPDLAVKLSARLSVKEKSESFTSGRPLFGSINTEEVEKLRKKNSEQKKELEDLKNKLHEAYLAESQMRDEVADLKNSISSMSKNTPKVEILRFLQCQSMMVENLLKTEDEAE